MRDVTDLPGCLSPVFLKAQRQIAISLHPLRIRSCFCWLRRFARNDGREPCPALRPAVPCDSKSCKERETANKSSNADVRYYLRPRTPRFHGAIPPKSSSLRVPSPPTHPHVSLLSSHPTICSKLKRNRILLGKLNSGILGH